MAPTKAYAGKILMLVENPFPEDPRIRREAYTLTKAGYKVTIVALKKGTGGKTREIVDGIHIYRFPRLTLFKKIRLNHKNILGKIFDKIKAVIGYLMEYFYFTTCCLLISPYLLWKEGFDVIHVHNPPDTLFLVALPYKLFGKKLVFDHHDLSAELYQSRFGANNDLVSKGLTLIEKICLAASDMVIATNASYKKIEIERGGVHPERIFIVRNGPDLERTQLVASDKELKGMKKTILAYLGAMNPQDGIDYLLRSLGHLVYDFGRKDFFCVCVGSGDSLPGLKAMATELKLDDYVRFTGWIPDEDMLRMLSSADICIDPDPSSPLNDVSTWIKIMEYMALGKPIVSFDLPETHYSAQDAAIYTTPNDEKEFAQAIITLMDDPGLREKMGKFGRKRIDEELSWQIVSKNLLRAYDWLLHNSVVKEQKPLMTEAELVT